MLNKIIVFSFVLVTIILVWCSQKNENFPIQNKSNETEKTKEEIVNFSWTEVTKTDNTTINTWYKKYKNEKIWFTIQYKSDWNQEDPMFDNKRYRIRFNNKNGRTNMVISIFYKWYNSFKDFKEWRENYIGNNDLITSLEEIKIKNFDIIKTKEIDGEWPIISTYFYLKKDKYTIVFSDNWWDDKDVLNVIETLVFNK